MASSVFFRFKSQKEPSRVTFDGTGLSVFELKQSIISISRLGDGLDFELTISAEGSNEVYDDDTAIVPRSSTVIARRLPAAKKGRGGAARYVSGKAPVNAKDTHRMEPSSARSNTGFRGSLGVKINAATADFSELETEEERIKAMFDLSAGQWMAQKQEMANATPVYRGGHARGRPVNVPDHPPPPGYVCYRCGKKGHYIQVCPENDNKALDGRPKIKRAAGIPTTMLRKVEEPTAFSNDGTIDETKRPSGAMLDANGNWVRAEPDKASWDQYQIRAKVSVAAQEAKAKESKELQDRGLECSIDKQMFVEPTKSPCCGTVFCKDCITNALLENDLQCPKCGKDVLLDDLKPDEEMQSRIQIFISEKQKVLKPQDGDRSPLKQEVQSETDQRCGSSAKFKEERSSLLATSNGNGAGLDLEIKKEPKHNHGLIEGLNSPTGRKSNSASPSTYATNKKRPADMELSGNRKAPNPPGKESSHNSEESEKPKQDQPSNISFAMSSHGKPVTPLVNYGQQMAAFNSFMGLGMSMPMSVPPMMGMASGMMNQQMPSFPFTADMSAWANMPSKGLQSNGLYGTYFPPNLVPNYGFNQTTMQMPFNSGMNGLSGMNQTHGPNGSNNNLHSSTPNVPQPFTNQQRTSFSNGPTNNSEDSPYFRQPVNPNRHQGRRNGNRPTSYREI